MRFERQERAEEKGKTKNNNFNTVKLTLVCSTSFKFLNTTSFGPFGNVISNFYLTFFFIKMH